MMSVAKVLSGWKTAVDQYPCLEITQEIIQGLSSQIQEQESHRRYRESKIISREEKQGIARHCIRISLSESYQLVLIEEMEQPNWAKIKKEVSKYLRNHEFIKTHNLYRQRELSKDHRKTDTETILAAKHSFKK